MEDRSEQVLAIAVTFMVVCWATVGLRVHCRLHVVKSFGRDDLVLVVLQVSCMHEWCTCAAPLLHPHLSSFPLFGGCPC